MISSLISTSELRNRRVLFLSTHKAAVYHWHKGEMGSSFLFDVNQEGRESFERYLRDTPNIPMHILVDVFDEEYKRDSIPHVFGSDRQAILKRKQQRLFHDTSYCYAEVQGREEAGRRDDRIFFSAITNPDVIRPWVVLLDRHKVPLAGINSLPLYTQDILESFTSPSNQILVVSLQSISGLRQTFFYKNEFRISRLVQMPRYGTASYAPYIRDEVEKIIRYLNSLRLTSEDSPLDVYFLLAGELLTELGKEYTDSGIVRYHFPDLNDLAEQSGLSRRINTPFSDQYYIYQFLNKPSSNKYADEKDRRYSTLRGIRYAMLTIIMVLIFGSVIWSGLNLIDGLTFKQSSLAAQKKTAFYTERYDIARKRLPETPVEPEDLETAVNIVHTLTDYKSTPADMVKVVSKILDTFPDIRLDGVEWATSTNPDHMNGADQSRAEMRGRNQTDPDTDMDSNHRYYQIGILSAHLGSFDGNYREAIATINEFTETLRDEEIVHSINIINLPIDISSTVNLQGDTRVNMKQADFTMRIVLGIGNET